MEFIEGWDEVQILGEGAFGEVKLLVCRSTGESVAVKILDENKEIDAKVKIKKEISVHRMLNNEHIIKFYGYRRHNCTLYLFLEYASGGELFDRLEPDVGMPTNEAVKYFRQLILGVEYLHSLGIAHRDIKPENLLLDGQNNLKISDFGMATLFRSNGQERLLETACGTKAYIAPEVLLKKYRAEPADVWSCGIVLVALLAGELPWDVPINTCKEYRLWKEEIISQSPWSKISTLPLSLLKKMLTPSACKRYKISDIKSHRFLNKTPRATESPRRLSNDSSFKRICSGITSSPISSREAVSRFSFSQPERGCESHGNDVVDKPDIMNNVCFSQPIHPEHMFLSSQVATQTASQTPQQKLVKRMTRFFVHTDAKETYNLLKQVFTNLFYNHKTTSRLITVTTKDRRKIELIFKVNIIDMNNQILIDFRLSKGDGIEFKKEFVKVKKLMKEYIIPGPITWPIAIATNTIP